MKLIHTHCSLDRRLAVLQFCAEGRVDFRELLRDLSHQFRTRVELRQVGVRDEAAIQGGIAACGRAFCCSSFLRQFKSINVKMAKMQGLSLNPNNISGACGRLKCCLEYEAELYREEYQKSRSRARDGDQHSRSGDRNEDSRRGSRRGDTPPAPARNARDSHGQCQGGNACPRHANDGDAAPKADPTDTGQPAPPQQQQQEQQPRQEQQQQEQQPRQEQQQQEKQQPRQGATQGEGNRSGSGRRRRRPRRNRGGASSGDSGKS